MTALVDAHVHLYDVFEPEGFLDSAAANARFWNAKLGLRADTPLFLLLTETVGDDAFESLALKGAAGDGWRLARLDEPVSLRALAPGRAPLYLVAGRQIVTAEGLEVLALGSRARFADGEAAAATVEAAMRGALLTVLPWAFGKWTGARGRLVAELLRRSWPDRLFVGDNGGRLAWSARPRLLQAAERAGLIVLPGSDPLPIAAEVAKAGRYGFVAECGLDPARPFAALAHWLKGRHRSPTSFGVLERTTTFLSRQVQMQLRKRLSRSRRA